MALDPKLLEILACPDDKGPLLYYVDEDALYNPRLKRRYTISDDIPIMLIDEAVTVDDAEHARLLAKAEAQGITPTFVDGSPAAPAPATKPPPAVEPAPAPAPAVEPAPAPPAAAPASPPAPAS